MRTVSTALPMAAPPAAALYPVAATTLVSRCQAGDRRAWQELFTQRSGQIYRWAVLLGLRPADAEEIAQEVFATAARRIATCRCDEALTSWLFQITRRLVANARRKAWWRGLLQSGEAREDEAAFEQTDTRDLALELSVRKQLAKLPLAQAEALVAVEIEGYSREEAAELLGIPPGTVASRLRLARQAMASVLGEDAKEVA